MATPCDFTVPWLSQGAPTTLRQKCYVKQVLRSLAKLQTGV
jgi:hypothetical protein